MASLARELDTVRVLWRRDLLRFGRQPSRLVGALGQPIIFWGVIGSGMGGTFALGDSGVSYLSYFYPGVVLMVSLFASIFASVSVIDDRHQGFLQAVLAGPGSRAALVVGKCLGSTSVALLQIGAFVALAPLAGFAYGSIDWLPLLLATAATSLGLCALGFAVAWGLDNSQAYHAIQMTFLVPLWVVSGAMFPPLGQSSTFGWLMRLNPLAYAVAAVRHALYGGHAPAETVLAVPVTTTWVVLAAFVACSLALAVWTATRRA